MTTKTNTYTAIRSGLLVALALALSWAAIGCAGSEDSDPEPTDNNVVANNPDLNNNTDWRGEEDLSVSERELMELNRVAISMGLDEGRLAFVDALNWSLSQNSVPYSYQSSTDIGEDYPEVSINECPFTKPAGAEVQTADCRALGDTAKIETFAALTQLLAQNELGPEFDANRDDHEFWLKQGMLTGIENETIIAIHTIRTQEVCDQAPTETADSFEIGVQRGRELYVDELNARLAETGNPMNYPTEVNPISVCAADNAFLAPARSRSLDNISGHVAANPLCADFNPTNPDEIANLGEATTKYQDGVRQGIEDEHSLASERIFRVVPCNVGDPLILDIDGDGVALKHVNREVEFDLYGWGQKVITTWVQGDDALLALDRNGNGSIDNGRELFVNFLGDTGYDEVTSGFENLAVIDSNRDGVVDHKDDLFAELRLWQDNNGDGVSQDGELSTLTDLGVSAIDLNYSEANGGKMPMPHRATFVRTLKGAIEHGSLTGDVYDAWFTTGRPVPTFVQR